MNVSAKSVVLEVLSAGESIYKGVLPVRSLVQAASVFDIAENSVPIVANPTVPRTTGTRIGGKASNTGTLSRTANRGNRNNCIISIFVFFYIISKQQNNKI